MPCLVRLSSPCTWSAACRCSDRRCERYRSSIYSMSLPSWSSHSLRRRYRRDVGSCRRNALLQAGRGFPGESRIRVQAFDKGPSASKPLTARVLRDGEAIDVDPKEIVKGDIVQVMPGEMIPIDGIIRSGASDIDTSSMTGESVPVHAVQETRSTEALLPSTDS